VALQLYDRSGRLIGVASACARPSIDSALLSLCDLLDHLRARQAWDAEPVMVHVNALKLLAATPELEGGPGAQSILDGLCRVSERYAAEQPSS
jgi:hypothetical protein